MTCKDCKKNETCFNPNKDYEKKNTYDNWADWCDEFESIHNDKRMCKDGFVIVQSGVNWHISIWDGKTGKMVFHASCTEEVKLEDLPTYLNEFLRIRKYAIEIGKERKNGFGKDN